MFFHLRLPIHNGLQLPRSLDTALPVLVGETGFSTIYFLSLCCHNRVQVEPKVQIFFSDRTLTEPIFDLVSLEFFKIQGRLCNLSSHKATQP